MTNPKQLRIENYTYDLPKDRIASSPTLERDRSKLLIWDNGLIAEEIFLNITHRLPDNSLIIFNNTRVIEARLVFYKPTGARIEIFCLEPGDMYPDITTALSQSKAVVWRCLVGNASSWTAGLLLQKTIVVDDSRIVVAAELIKKEADHFVIRLSWAPEKFSFAEVLHYTGAIPLPPYIKRDADASDAERYQTVYAHFSGSVAAPTAGLHFTTNILDHLAEKKIKKDFVTLHVGAGTFKPVKSNIMQHHEMHAESIEISPGLVDNILNHYKRNIIAVGTTSLRTLESLYWLGRKLFLNKDLPEEDLAIQQWEPYEDKVNICVEDALVALRQYIILSRNNLLVTKTSLLIAPGYQFRIVNVLITNFHQPRSTLLLLIAAFIGDNWKSVYAYALENDFRFLSYGDACLFFRQ